MTKKEVLKIGRALDAMTKTDGWRYFQELLQLKQMETAIVSMHPDKEAPHRNKSWHTGRYEALGEVLELVDQAISNAREVAKEVVATRTRVPTTRFGWGSSEVTSE